VKILITTATIAAALPLMAVAQNSEPQPSPGQTNETQTTAPAKGKNMRSAQDQTKPETKSATDTRTNVQGRTEGTTKTETGARSSTSSTTQKTTVNKQEFRSRHTEVFTLGRHPKEFFVQKFGANHFRLIGNTYFVFVDSCWVAVDVDGFTYTERMICPGDPDFIEVD